MGNICISKTLQLTSQESAVINQNEHPTSTGFQKSISLISAAKKKTKAEFNPIKSLEFKVDTSEFKTIENDLINLKNKNSDFLQLGQNQTTSSQLIFFQNRGSLDIISKAMIEEESSELSEDDLLQQQVFRRVKPKSILKKSRIISQDQIEQSVQRKSIDTLKTVRFFLSSDNVCDELHKIPSY